MKKLPSKVTHIILPNCSMRNAVERIFRENKKEKKEAQIVLRTLQKCQFPIKLRTWTLPTSKASQRNSISPWTSGNLNSQLQSLQKIFNAVISFLFWALSYRYYVEF